LPKVYAYINALKKYHEKIHHHPSANFAAITLAFPQSVSNFNLQVALRTEHGTIMTNQQFDIRVTLLSETQGSSPTFTETHSTTTNSQGIANQKLLASLAKANFQQYPDTNSFRLR